MLQTYPNDYSYFLQIADTPKMVRWVVRYLSSVLQLDMECSFSRLKSQVFNALIGSHKVKYTIPAQLAKSDCCLIMLQNIKQSCTKHYNLELAPLRKQIKGLSSFSHLFRSDSLSVDAQNVSDTTRYFDSPSLSLSEENLLLVVNNFPHPCLKYVLFTLWVVFFVFLTLKGFSAPVLFSVLHPY